MATTLKYKSGSTWVDILHPVGSMWLSHQSTSLSSLFGGTWTQLTNAVPRAANAYGYNGSDTMSLTVNQMPAHSHTIRAFSRCICLEKNRLESYPYSIILLERIAV